MLTTEFDSLSKDIQMQITSNVECNFSRATADNITRVLHILASAADYGKVQISQLEVGIQLNLSQNRVSELLNLAKKTGLIGIEMICRCGDVRNEYTLLNNPIVNTIKNIVFKSSHADPRAKIDLALSHTMAFYRREGKQEHILEEVKRRMPMEEFKKANGILKYFRKVLRTIEMELLEPSEAGTYKKKKSAWNNYGQRPYDPLIEKQLLEKINIENEEPFDMHSALKEFRE